MGYHSLRAIVNRFKIIAVPVAAPSFQIDYLKVRSKAYRCNSFGYHFITPTAIAGLAAQLKDRCVIAGDAAGISTCECELRGYHDDALSNSMVSHARRCDQLILRRRLLYSRSGPWYGIVTWRAIDFSFNLSSCPPSLVTQMLDLVEVPLRRDGFQFVRLDG